MPQLTVRIPEEIDLALAVAADKLQRKRAEIVRIALRRFLGLDTKSKAADRARILLGSLESGVPDLAENHRQYLIESLRRGS